MLFRASEGAEVQYVSFMDNVYTPLNTVETEETLFLLGVDLDAAEGSYPVVAAIVPGGEETVATVKVVKGEYPVERLQLPEKMVTPPPETLERITREREAAAAVYRESVGTIFWRPPFHRPVETEGSRNFGRRRVLNGVPRSPHSGEDFSSPLGTEVRAAAGGVVRMARDLYFSGNTILIDHGGGLVSQYFHLNELRAAEGSTVAKGEVVGTVGATGRVTGPHLHFGLRLHSMRVNPSQVFHLFDN